MRRTRILRAPFEKTLEMVAEGDFVYMDPPYSIGSRRVFNEYSNFHFGDSEVRQLRRQLLLLDKMGIPFLVSYGFSREGIYLSRGFRHREVQVQRQIAASIPNRKMNRELLITNY